MAKRIRSRSKGQTVAQKLADARAAIRSGDYADVLAMLDRTMRRCLDLKAIGGWYWPEGKQRDFMLDLANDHADLAYGLARLLFGRGAGAAVTEGGRDGE